jgi:hypothetical protein
MWSTPAIPVTTSGKASGSFFDNPSAKAGSHHFFPPGEREFEGLIYQGIFR